MKKRKIVIALGGNALVKNVEEQQEAVEHTAKVIVDLEQQGYDLIITHGNGPQVGMPGRRGGNGQPSDGSFGLLDGSNRAPATDR